MRVALEQVVLIPLFVVAVPRLRLQQAAVAAEQKVKTEKQAAPVAVAVDHCRVPEVWAQDHKALQEVLATAQTATQVEAEVQADQVVLVAQMAQAAPV